MPVRKNPAYSDPYMAQAAGNIAKLFAPDPNIGSNSLAFQKAAAEKQSSEQLAQLYEYSKRPDYDQAQFDRSAIAAGRYQPNQSFYSVDTDATTKRRGQDVEAAAKRDVASIEQAGSLSRLYAQPVITSEGQTAYIPDQTQAATGFGPVLTGQTRVKPGEVVIRSGGERIEGNPIPLSEDQVKAAALNQMPLFLRQQFALTGPGAQDVLTPEGPRVQSRAGAVGLPPVQDPAKTSDTEISRLIAERDRLPEGDPNRKAYSARIEALGRGQQQSAYDKETDEGFAKTNAKIGASADTARTQMGSLRYMRQLLSNPETQQGFGAETALEVKKALEVLGVPVGNTSDAEVARALSNKLALYAKNEGGENLMPGALSDSDRPFLQRQVAGLGNTREANMKLIGYYERVQQRAIDVDKLRQSYVDRKGRLDEGFRRELTAWSEKNPVFPEGRQPGAGGSGPSAPAGATRAPAAAVAPSTAPPAAPQPGEVVDGYRFNGGNPADPASWARAQ